MLVESRTRNIADNSCFIIVFSGCELADEKKQPFRTDEEEPVPA
jgi:hypothetical protein